MNKKVLTKKKQSAIIKSTNNKRVFSNERKEAYSSGHDRKFNSIYQWYGKSKFLC